METVATPVLDELHVNVAPAIVLSFASFRVAVMVAVSLNDEKLKLVAESVIDVATGVGVVGVVGAVGVDPPPSPQARRKSTTATRTNRISLPQSEPPNLNS